MIGSNPNNTNFKLPLSRVDVVAPEIQPNNKIAAAGGLDDEKGFDDSLLAYPTGSIAESISAAGFDHTAEQSVKEKDNEAPAEIPPTTPIQCNSAELLRPFPSNFKLSTNYTLSGLTTSPVVSTYSLRAQLGLTEEDIVCNLMNLSENVLEHMLDMFSSLQLNSGFRHGSGGSQHNKGQAVDIQFSGLSAKGYFDRAKIVKDAIDYDQFILEYGRNPWFHLSFNPTGNRRQVLTRIRPGKYVSGLIRLR